MTMSLIIGINVAIFIPGKNKRTINIFHSSFIIKISHSSFQVIISMIANQPVILLVDDTLITHVRHLIFKF